MDRKEEQGTLDLLYDTRSFVASELILNIYYDGRFFIFAFLQGEPGLRGQDGEPGIEGAPVRKICTSVLLSQYHIILHKH